MTPLSNLTALAVGIAVIAPAQAQTVVSTKVATTAEVTVLSSGTPVVSGAVTLRMPGTVDASGDMMYDVSKVNLRDTVRGYVAASWTSMIDKTGFLSLSAQVDNQHQLGAAFRFNKMF